MYIYWVNFIVYNCYWFGFGEFDVVIVVVDCG